IGPVRCQRYPQRIGRQGHCLPPKNSKTRWLLGRSLVHRPRLPPRVLPDVPPLPPILPAHRTDHVQESDNREELSRRENQCLTDRWPIQAVFWLEWGSLQLDRVFPPPVRVFAPSIPIRSPRVPHSQLRSSENCSTPSPPDVHTTQLSQDCDECSAASPQTAG